jgi:hypothetical protein
MDCQIPIVADSYYLQEISSATRMNVSFGVIRHPAPTSIKFGHVRYSPRKRPTAVSQPHVAKGEKQTNGSAARYSLIGQGFDLAKMIGPDFHRG